MELFQVEGFDSESFCGYKQITTFYTDFSIAEHFGEGAINDTFNRAFNEWKHDYKYLTELVMVLNWKLWVHYGRGMDKGISDSQKDNAELALAKVYDKLWKKADAYACSHLKGKELAYFYETTD